MAQILQDLSYKVCSKYFRKWIIYSTGCSKKLFLILRLNFGAVYFSKTKMLAFPDSRDMYK